MPDWDSTASIPYHQLRPVKPRVKEMPKPRIINIYNATFEMKFWEKSNIYAIIVESFGT